MPANTNQYKQGNNQYQHQSNNSHPSDASAPYNFIPLPEEARTDALPPPEADRYYPSKDTEPARYSGYFDVTLTALTPLYTRASLTQAEYEHKLKVDKDNAGPEQHKAEFFSPGYPADRGSGKVERPDIRPYLRIPGSSLRGMVRTLLEIAARVPVEGISRERYFYRAVADQRALPLAQLYSKQIHDPGKPDSPVQAGYIVRNGSRYHIYPAAPVNGYTSFRISHSRVVSLLSSSNIYFTRQPVWYKPPSGLYETIEDIKLREPDNMSNPPDNAGGWLCGFLVVPGKAPSQINNPDKEKKKKHWVITAFDSGAVTPIFISDDDRFAYQDGGGVTYGNKKLPGLPKESGTSERNIVPCFYRVWAGEDGETRVSFGHTGFFRTPYLTRPSEAVPPELLKPLNSPDQGWDLAEAIFGTAAGSRSDSFAGRVFFEDAVFVNGEEFEDFQIPRVLSNPKPTTFQHYLEQPESSQPQNRYNQNRRLENMEYWDTPGAVIRGYKLYWHREPEPWEDKTNTENIRKFRTQLTRMRPVNSGAVFSFKLNFENLTRVELGALSFVIQLPAGYAHKLGMAKSRGLGSVRLDSKIFLSDRSKRYSTLFAGSDKNALRWQEALTEVSPQLFVGDFEEWLKCSPGELWRTDRMQELAAMLNYEGKPAQDNTAYMQLNDFKLRKLLPYPSEVIGRRKPGEVSGKSRSKPSNISKNRNEKPLSPDGPNQAEGVRGAESEAVVSSRIFVSKERSDDSQEQLKARLEEKVKSFVDLAEKNQVMNKFGGFIDNWKKLNNDDPLKVKLGVKIWNHLLEFNLATDHKWKYNKDVQLIYQLLRKAGRLK